MDKNWNSVQLVPEFSEQGVDCYKLENGNFLNEYYIVSEAGTRKLMNSPEVVGYSVYKSLVKSTSQMLHFLKGKNAITRANILSILRGALNYPLEEACYNEHMRVHNISFLSCERVISGTEIVGLDVKYKKLALVPDSTLMIGDIIASGVTLIECLKYVVENYRQKNMELRNIIFFTIGGTKGVQKLEALTKEIRSYWPEFEGFIAVYYEGIFSCYEEGDRGVSGINIADIDFYWKGGVIAPEFRRETLSQRDPLFEKCTIYDGGARRYEIEEHIEEVLEFWNHMKEHADDIAMTELLEEKLGHALDISYEDWLKDCHYSEIEGPMTKWLYAQEKGFIDGVKDLSIKTIAEERIQSFSKELRKYIIQ